MWALFTMEAFFFFFNSNDIKLTLTNTSHIVPSNCNVETYLAVDVVCLFLSADKFEQDVISDHIISFFQSLNCS